MILRNWMRKEPVTVTSDSSVIEATRIIAETNLRALPVVDEGQLRGIVTRRDLLGAADLVARTQDMYEVEYYTHRLKIKDLMIRWPKTMNVDDTVEYCMLKGQEEQVSFYPVMDGEQLMGTVSSVEIFRSLAQILGTGEKWRGITLGPMPIENGTLGRVADVVEAQGAVLHGIFTMRLNGSSHKKVILRFETEDLNVVVKALSEAGFPPLEVISEVQACRLNGERVTCPVD
jgi:acetoin utilization protein AcuB